ncbi:hypothetical protein [uncultured Mediterranean phage uvMED]|nr:hypothetical protein [uncultured Mediterranean phage uvMED]
MSSEIVLRNIQKIQESGGSMDDVINYLGQENRINSNQKSQFEIVIRDRFASPNIPLEKPNVIERLGRGFYDVVKGTQQAFNQLSPEEIETERQQQELYERAVGDSFDIPRFLGQSAGLVPLGLIATKNPSVAAKLVSGGLLGAAGGYSLFEPDQSDKNINAIVSGVLGAPLQAFAPTVGRKVGDVVNFVGERLKTTPQINIQNLINETIISKVDEYPSLLNSNFKSNVAQNVTNRAVGLLNSNQPFDENAAVNKEVAESFGFVGDSALTRGQATRDPRIIATETNLQKREAGKPILTVKENQMAQSINVMDDFASPFDDLGSNQEVVKKLVNAIKNKSNELQVNVTEAYNAIPRDYMINNSTFSSNMTDILDQFEDNISSSVKRRIQRLSKEQFSVDEMLKLERLINDTMSFNPSDPSRNIASSRLKQAITNTLDETAVNETDQGLKSALLKARETARNRFEAIRESKNNSVIQNVLKDKTDDLEPRILQASSRDIRAIKNLLSEEEFRNLQALFARQIRNKSVPVEDFRFAQYNRLVNEGIGKEKLEAVFGENIANSLQTFRQVAKNVHSSPQLAPINFSGSGAEVETVLTDTIEGLLDVAVPGGGAIKRRLSQAQKKKLEAQKEQDSQNFARSLLSDQPVREPLQNIYDITIPLDAAVRNRLGLPPSNLPIFGDAATFGGLLESFTIPASAVIGSDLNN